MAQVSYSHTWNIKDPHIIPKLSHAWQRGQVGCSGSWPVIGRRHGRAAPIRAAENEESFLTLWNTVTTGLRPAVRKFRKARNLTAGCVWSLEF